MRVITPITLLFSLFSFATKWQPPETVNGLSNITGLNLDSNNTIMYCAKWHDGYWGADIGYYIWDGSSWVWGDWVQGNVNTNEYEEEPFVTYDGQHLYFQRWNGSTNPALFISDWDGSGFANSQPLNSSINQGDSRYPGITQDMQLLYYAKGLKVYVSEWDGSDWGIPTMLPAEVNGGGGMYRENVTITPDGNEIYFTGAGSYVNKLAFSQKIGGVWQQWQYCDYNINPPSYPQIAYPAFTYSDYANQYLYFGKNIAPYYYRSLRSPVSVEPASLGQIKANYAR
jgi:hypothetical protein